MANNMAQQIGYNEAKELANNIKNSADTINDILNNSHTIVKNVSENWEGTAAEVAITEWEDGKKSFEDYYQMLVQNVKNIEQACNDFLAAETKMQQEFRG